MFMFFVSFHVILCFIYTMTKKNNTFTPNKHVPKGFTILYEDIDIIVINKNSGLLTIGTERERVHTAYSLLTNYVQKGNPKSKNRVFIVHRLDRDTSGLLIFAKNEKSKRFLQDNWQDFTKTYYALVHGVLTEKKGEITSYLIENNAYRVFSTTNTAEGKFAKTGYEVLKESESKSLVEVTLYTGRKNQIRVHFSEMNHPIIGDKTYGQAQQDSTRLCLHSASIEFVHPYSKDKMVFATEIPSYFKSLV